MHHHDHHARYQYAQILPTNKNFRRYGNIVKVTKYIL